MEDVIGSIVEKELGEPPVCVKQIEEGLIHQTFELRCNDDVYILQLSESGEKRRDALKRGLHWYLLLADSEIPVPSVVTETVRDVDDRCYMLVERLPGKSAERDISREKVRNAGRYLAKIHDYRSFETAGRIRFDDQGLTVSEFPEGDLARRIRRSIEECARTLQEGGLTAAGNAVCGLRDSVGTVVPDEFQPVLCHDDYTADNVLFQDGDVTGILDFDNAYAGHSHRDLAKAANGFWMHDPGSDWNVRGEFYEGYRDEIALDDSFERDEPFYRAETHAGTIADLLRGDVLSDYEKEFYSETILQAVERVEER